MPDHKGRIIGVVQVLNKRARPLRRRRRGAARHRRRARRHRHRELQALLNRCSARTWRCLDAQEQLRQRIAELDLLFEIEREASAALDLDGLLSRLLVARHPARRRRGGIDPAARASSGELFFRTALGSRRRVAAAAASCRPAKASSAGWRCTKQPLVVNDPVHDARHDLYIAEKIGVPARSILAVPLLAPRAAERRRGGALGAIELVNKRSGAARLRRRRSAPADAHRRPGVARHHRSRATARSGCTRSGWRRSGR